MNATNLNKVLLIWLFHNCIYLSSNVQSYHVFIDPVINEGIPENMFIHKIILKKDKINRNNKV